MSHIVNWFINCPLYVVYFLFGFPNILFQFSRVSGILNSLALNIDICTAVSVLCNFICSCNISVYWTSRSFSYLNISDYCISCDSLLVPAVLIKSNICNSRFSCWNSYWSACCLHCVVILNIFSNIAVNLEITSTFPMFPVTFPPSWLKPFNTIEPVLLWTSFTFLKFPFA